MPEPAAPTPTRDLSSVVLFDGVCNFCNLWAQALLRLDRRGVFKLAAMQSPAGEAILRAFQLPTTDFDTMVVIDDGRVWTKSSAILRMAQRLPFPTWLPAIFWVVPRPVRDWVYSLVARNRYAWFGKRDVCMVPTPAQRARFLLALVCGAVLGLSAPMPAQTWTADNGNGTFTNPLFFEEFSDPDLIRVGEYFYMTGTTMHTMPGLPVLRSRDLVNWEFMSYALDRLDLGPAYRLEGDEIYGRGIWAPSLRYHDGTFHIFTNVNGQTTQHFTATDARGPWTRTAMNVSLHDLSVLFDDDGKVYAVWGYQDMRLAQLNDALTDTVPGTVRTLFARDAGMGEGAHFYKIDSTYLITSAWYAGRMRLAAARATTLDGPWEVNRIVSVDEHFGLRQGARLRGNGRIPEIVMNPGNPTARGGMAMHQGGIVQTPAGEWWGWSMYEANSLGRTTALSPVTWKDGWPYFGLPGNLTRSPRTWLKPRISAAADASSPAPQAPFQRNDPFSGPVLANVWQWNHVPDDTKWSLTERPGFLRLHALPAPDFWMARNSLTQRIVGPASSAETMLETAGMQPGDIAGVAVLNRPYAWIGVRRAADGDWLERYDQLAGDTLRIALTQRRVWLRLVGDVIRETVRFTYSLDGVTYAQMGEALGTAFQLKTFQGVRYALFHYNARGGNGGYADFDEMRVIEEDPRERVARIPVGERIALEVEATETPFVMDGVTAFTVEDRGQGRVALRVDNRYISVTPTSDSTSTVALRTVRTPGDAETFQWIESFYGEVALMSVRTHRYLRVERDGRVTSDSRGLEPDPADGTALLWRVRGPL